MVAKYASGQTAFGEHGVAPRQSPVPTSACMGDARTNPTTRPHVRLRRHGPTTQPWAKRSEANSAMGRAKLGVPPRALRVGAAGAQAKPGSGEERTAGAAKPRALPTAFGQPMRLWDLLDVDADHGFAEAARDLGDDVGVIVERGGLDDRRCPLGRVSCLEDA